MFFHGIISLLSQYNLHVVCSNVFLIKIFILASEDKGTLTERANVLMEQGFHLT